MQKVLELKSQFLSGHEIGFDTKNTFQTNQQYIVFKRCVQLN